MAKFVRGTSRLLFAPEAIGRHGGYIDRIELESTGVHLVLPGGDVRRFSDALIGDVFSRGPRQGRVSIRKNWHFGGHMQVSRQDGGLGLHVVLSLNPTRFVQAHGQLIPRETRAALFADLTEALGIGIRGNRAAAASLDDAARLALDRSSNVLVNFRSRISDWPVRVKELLELVLQLIDVHVERAARHSGGGGNAGLLAANWRIKQVEYYWEFAVQDAIGKLLAVSETTRRTLRDGYTSTFPPKEGFDRNAPFVSGHLEHQDIRAKLYAKTAHAVRFEIAYDKSPASFLPSNSGLARGGSTQLVADQLAVLSADASERARRFWRSFWSNHSLGTRPSAEQIVRFFRLLQNASEEGLIGAEGLLSLLISNDGGEPFEAGRGPDPIRLLVRHGVLRRVPGSAPRRARYEVHPRYRGLVQSLRNAPSEPLGEDGLYPDEDGPSAAGPAPRARNEYRALNDAAD